VRDQGEARGQRDLPQDAFLLMARFWPNEFGPTVGSDSFDQRCFPVGSNSSDQRCFITCRVEFIRPAVFHNQTCRVEIIRPAVFHNQTCRVEFIRPAVFHNQTCRVEFIRPSMFPCRVEFIRPAVFPNLMVQRMTSPVQCVAGRWPNEFGPTNASQDRPNEFGPTTVI